MATKSNRGRTETLIFLLLQIEISLLSGLIGRREGRSRAPVRGGMDRAQACWQLKKLFLHDLGIGGPSRCPLCDLG